MNLRSLFLIGFLFNYASAQHSEDSYKIPKIGWICHADADDVIFNFPGVWEKRNDGSLFCNYERFLTEADIEAAQYTRDDIEVVDESDALEDSELSDEENNDDSNDEQ